MEDERAQRQPTQELRVEAGDGRHLAVTCTGAGEPPVLLETGFGAESAAWSTVAQRIAAFTRVCAYDRASRGASDPASRPRQPGHLLADVNRVLDAVAPRQRVVLVGQSFGGLIARLYAFRHPDRVAAVVLVDSLHEDQFELCGPMLPPAAAGEPAMLTSMRPFWTGGWRDPSRNQEGIDMVACQAAAREITGLTVPVRVLTANTWLVPPLVEPNFARPLQGAWETLQRRLASLSADGRHRLVPESGHFMQTDAPQAIVGTVRELVEALQVAGRLH